MTEPPAPLFDLESGYSASLIHFALIHWQELDSHSLREALAREWEMLPRHASGVPYRLCLCGKLFEKQAAAEMGGIGRPSPRTPATLMLDLQMAYNDLPVSWSGRTEAWLLMNGSTEEQIRDMKLRGAWAHIHRSRVMVDTYALGDRYPRAQDSDPEVQTPWARMANVLNGFRSHPMMADTTATVAA